MESYLSEFNTLGDRGFVNDDTRFPLVADFIDWFNRITTMSMEERCETSKVSSQY